MNRNELDGKIQTVKAGSGRRRHPHEQLDLTKVPTKSPERHRRPWGPAARLAKPSGTSATPSK